MRTIMRIQMPAERGSAALKSGKLQEVMKQFADRWKPEAAYFFPLDGKRTAVFVFDLKEPSQLPSIVEPFFAELNAEVYTTTAMNMEDLMKGLSQLR